MTQVLDPRGGKTFVTMTKKQLACDSISEAMIYEKGKKLHSDLPQEDTFISAKIDQFKANRGWFDQFHKWHPQHDKMVRLPVLTVTEQASRKKFSRFMKAGPISQQVFKCNETQVLLE